MSTIDLICAICLGFGFWVGYQRGIIQLAFNLISYTFGIVLAFKMTPAMTNLLIQVFKSDNSLMFFAGFLVNFAIVMMLIRLAAKSLESLFQAAYLGTFNQILGGVVYGGFFVLIYSVLLWFGRQSLVVSESMMREAKTGEILEKLPAQAKNLAIRVQPTFAEIWHTSMEWVDKAKNQSEKNKKWQENEPKIYDLEEDKPTGQQSSRGIEDFPEDLTPSSSGRKKTPAADDDGIENN